MKKSFLLLLTFIVCIVTMAGPVTPDEARQNVAKFMNPRRAAAVTQHPEALRLVQTSYYKVKEAVSAPSYYVFNVGQNNGYVIAAADDRVPAVLGYSNHGAIDPDNMPENMKAWLQGYNDQIEYLNRHPEAATTRRTVVGEAISPLLGSNWDQKTPYNDLCPIDAKEHSLTGCVATAMAQVMYFWKYPAATTNPIPSYTSTSRRFLMPEIPAGTAIDWNNMVNKYDGSETDIQKKAIANLMLLCGTAVRMNYTNNFSSAYDIDVALALRNYFGYDDATTYVMRNDYFESDWNQRVYDELKAGRPVYYSGTSSGTGHAFVVDGYGGDDYFHVNWGWGGMSNDYFLLSILDSDNNSGSGASMSADGYSFGQGAIFGARPSTGIPNSAIPILTTDQAVVFSDSVMTRTSTDQTFKFTVGFSQISHMNDTYTYELGTGFYSTNGELLQAMPATTTEMSYNWGYQNAKNAQTTFTIGKNVENLTCIIKPISRLANTQIWYADKGSDIYNIKAVIQGNTLKLFAPVFNMTGKLVVNGNKEVGSIMPITATITNNGTLWKGEIFIMQNGNMKGGRHIDFQPGETKNVKFSITPDSVGKIEFAIATSRYNTETREIDYTKFITDSINIDSASIANLKIQYGVSNATDYVTKENALKLTVRATNNGTSAYNNTIKVDMLKDGHNGYFYQSKTIKQDVKIESGAYTDSYFNFENLEDDDYMFFISYLSGGKWISIQTRPYTVQVHEPAPAPVLSTTSRTANAVRESGSWIVKSDTALISVTVKNTGTLEYNDNIVVRLYQVTTATGGPLVAAAQTPVQLAAGADTTIVVQFTELKDGASYFYWTNYIVNRKEVPGSQNTPVFTVVLPKETGIQSVGNDATQGNAVIYSLNGNKVVEVKAADVQQHLKQLPKGLYIVRTGQRTRTVRN